MPILLFIKMKFAVIYCIWNDLNVIREVEIIDEVNLCKAIEKTNRNLETNIVIPLNKHNKEMLKKIIQNKQEKA